jgi:hypothetical protein
MMTRRARRGSGETLRSSVTRRSVGRGESKRRWIKICNFNHVDKAKHESK